MRLRALPILMVGLFVLALAGGASAEEKHLSFGVQASYGSDTDFGIGALARLDLDDVYEGLGVVGSFNYFFPSTDDVEGVDTSAKYWELNANATKDFKVSGSATPYVGAGLVLGHASASGSIDALGVDVSASDSKLGANILAGAKMDVGESMKLFIEAKYEFISDGKQFVVSGGVRF